MFMSGSHEVFQSAYKVIGRKTDKSLYYRSKSGLSAQQFTGIDALTIVFLLRQQ